MERPTYETAGILRDLYNEEFGGDEFEPYQIGWDQLRGIAGVERLTDSILSDIGTAMLDSGYALVPFDNFLLVTMESNFKMARKVPPRIVEMHLATSENESVDAESADYELAGTDGTQEIEDDVV